MTKAIVHYPFFFSLSSFIMCHSFPTTIPKKKAQLFFLFKENHFEMGETDGYFSVILTKDL
jgi:hypothetical protein